MLFGSECLCTQQPVGNLIFLVIPQTLYGSRLILTLQHATCCGNTGSKTSDVQYATYKSTWSFADKAVRVQSFCTIQGNSPLHLLQRFIKGKSYSKLKQMPPAIPAESRVQTDLFQVKCQNRSASCFCVFVCVCVWVRLCALKTKRRSQTVFPKCIDFSSSRLHPPLTFHRHCTAQSQYTGWWKPVWPCDLWTLSDVCLRQSLVVTVASWETAICWFILI